MHSSSFQVIHRILDTRALGRTAAGAGQNVSVPVQPTPTLINVTASAAASKAAAQAALTAFEATSNDAISHTFPLIFTLAFLAFLLLSSVAIAGSLASGRFSQGWMLFGGGSKRSGRDRREEWGVRRGRTIPTLMDVNKVGWLSANLRTLHNAVLLPSIPILNLTIGQVLICLFYQGTVVACLLYNLGDPIIDFKRPAFLALGQLPVVFALASKNNTLSLAGKGYEKLHFLHRTAGRMLILCCILHASFFIKHKGGFSKVPFSNPMIYTGVTALSSMILVAITSISFFRNAFYRLFLVCHIGGWTAFLIAINFHVPSIARTWTLIALGIYGTDILTRLLKTRFKSATLVPLAGAMTMVEIEGLNQGWRPGQHVHLRVLSGMGFLGWENHPFTIANAPTEISAFPGRHNLTLLAKAKGSWTRSLHDVSCECDVEGYESEKSAFGRGKTVSVAISGPYGGAMYHDFAEAEAVILVAGGSGISFVAGILEELVSLAAEGTCRTRTITLVWSMKIASCREWYEEALAEIVKLARARTQLHLNVHLFVTDSSASSPASIIPGATVALCRPNLSSLLDPLLDDIIFSLPTRAEAAVRGGGVMIGTCGPRALADEVAKAVRETEWGRSVQVGGIVCHTESFGW